MYISCTNTAPTLVLTHLHITLKLDVVGISRFKVFDFKVNKKKAHVYTA